ncbi:MAG: threonine synthase [Verrucomicrobiota bacterium]|nr:threonine synthase [Verrucomicrobiota bacterium]
MSFVTHLECANCGRHYPAGQPHNLCTDCQRPLWVRYDLDRVREVFPREALANRPADLWRYRELLPYADPENVVSLGETMTPILLAQRLGAELGLDNLVFKDESRLPTGSFKARGMAMAITMANEFGIQRVACPTAGNAGGAMAAYASRAGMESYVFMPDDTPVINIKETHLAGASVIRVNGLINDCGRLVGEGCQSMGWFDLSTLKEPYRIEGKKTMGLELAEQLDWELPDIILYPTGGGTGLIGMWKAFTELEAIGWLPGGKRPRMISCQSDGCAPIATAFEAGEKHAPPFENAHTVASGLRVPVAVGDFMILDAVRESGGCAVTAPESCIEAWMKRLARLEGLAVCPETAICMGVLDQLLANGTIRTSDRVLVFNTGGAMKYPDLIEEPTRHHDLGLPPDWKTLSGG